ncbi:S8 family serine peptidase [bacterium]|nr:S8 family serine peptidase [bacterium]
MKKIILTILLLIILLSAQDKYWIYFSDKGLYTAQDTVAAIEKTENILTERCLTRRAKVLSIDRIVDWQDIPVCVDYIEQVKFTGAKIVHISRWLNAVSVYANPDILSKIADFPFIQKIDIVQKFHRKFMTEDTTDYSGEAIYGMTKNQLAFMNIPPLHQMGVFGDGVLLCITDTGFNLDHIAFTHCNVEATYDFVSGDSIVDVQEGDNDGIVSHGTKCWSEIGGRVDSLYWGAAPNTSFLLARTEDIDTEWIIEEDNWAAAAEWADSLGADIMSVSLGYYDWYTSDDMDGDTPVITAAADRAVYLGIAVFTAAGNSGGGGYRTLVTPGDGDSVITVGACDGNGNLAGFSSRGPTADGRIKPDILAHGVGTICANGMDDSTFSSASGTSMATPMAAGIGALLLSLRTSLTPMDLLDILRKTADNFISPDSAYGWGIIDARAAAAYPFRDSSFIYFERGWNIIALPVDTVLLADILPTIPYVYSFDGSTFVSVDTLQPGIGYFAFFTVDTFAILTGRPIIDLNIVLHRGWNLIGGLSRTTFTTELETLPLTDKFFITENEGYNLSCGLIPSRGGWFYATYDHTAHLVE